MIEADNVVVALGSFSPALLRQVGIDVLIYPVKGVSITVPRAPWKERRPTPSSTMGACSV